MKLVLALMLCLALTSCASNKGAGNESNTSGKVPSQGGPGLAKELAGVSDAQKLAKRPLTDADIDRYCAFFADNLKATKTAKTADERRRATEEALQKHNMTATEYAILNGRIMGAVMMLSVNKPCPEAQKADCDVVSRNMQKINDAQK
jgi:hypothetical protein